MSMSDLRECSSRDIRSCRAVIWVDWICWADNRFPTISSRANARTFSVCNADREPRVTSARLAAAVQPEQIDVMKHIINPHLITQWGKYKQLLNDLVIHGSHITDTTSKNNQVFTDTEILHNLTIIKFTRWTITHNNKGSLGEVNQILLLPS